MLPRCAGLTPPATPRTFDLELAKTKLEAAGYILDSASKRLDKDGKVLDLRLYMPDSEQTYPDTAQFIQDWFAELGIGITTQVFDSGTLTDLMNTSSTAWPLGTSIAFSEAKSPPACQCRGRHWYAP